MQINNIAFFPLFSLSLTLFVHQAPHKALLQEMRVHAREKKREKRKKQVQLNSVVILSWDAAFYYYFIKYTTATNAKKEKQNSNMRKVIKRIDSS